MQGINNGLHPRVIFGYITLLSKLMGTGREGGEESIKERRRESGRNLEREGQRKEGREGMGRKNRCRIGNMEEGVEKERRLNGSAPDGKSVVLGSNPDPPKHTANSVSPEVGSHLG
jgi:hypothetical protein